MKSFFNPTAWTQGKKRSPNLPQCGRCGLSKTCYSPKMPPTGVGSRSILFVAEAPGEEEDRQGVQLVGKNGDRLRKDLKRLKFNLDHAHKTNAIICRPPENKALPLHVECCRPNLLKTVRELKPKVIVLLGGSAVRSLIKHERDAKVGKAGRWVGWTIPSHEHQAWICPTYHPAHLLRQEDPVLDERFFQHLKAALKLEKVPVDSPSLGMLKERVERIQNPRLARKRLKDLLGKEGRLAFDYESTGLKPEHPRQQIVSVSFCLEGEDTFAVMWSDKVAGLVSKILKKKELQKIAHNLKHEERWTVSKLGHRVRGWIWDTMLAAHYQDNRGDISSLKFQAYIHYGVADYDAPVSHFMKPDEKGFNTIKECPPEQLLLYNGLDSLFTFMVFEKQKKAMRL